MPDTIAIEKRLKNALFALISTRNNTASSKCKIYSTTIARSSDTFFSLNVAQNDRFELVILFPLSEWTMSDDIMPEPIDENFVARVLDIRYVQTAEKNEEGDRVMITKSQVITTEEYHCLFVECNAVKTGASVIAVHNLNNMTTQQQLHQSDQDVPTNQGTESYDNKPEAETLLRIVIHVQSQQQQQKKQTRAKSILSKLLSTKKQIKQEQQSELQGWNGELVSNYDTESYFNINVAELVPHKKKEEEAPTFTHHHHLHS